MDRVDVFKPLKMADGYARQFSVAAPLAFAGYDEVEIELANQCHAMSPRSIVDASEYFVQQHKTWRVRSAALAVEARDRREQGHGKAQRPLPARSGP